MRYTKANKKRLTPPYKVFWFLFIFISPKVRLFPPLVTCQERFLKCLQFVLWMCCSSWKRLFQQKVGRVGVWLAASPSAQPIVKRKVTRTKDLLNLIYVHVQKPGWTGGERWPHPVNRFLSTCLSMLKIHLALFKCHLKVGRVGKLLTLSTRSTALLSCYPFRYSNTKKYSRLKKRRGSVIMVYQPINPHFLSGLDKRRSGGEW